MKPYVDNKPTDYFSAVEELRKSQREILSYQCNPYLTNEMFDAILTEYWNLQFRIDTLEDSQNGKNQLQTSLRTSEVHYRETDRIVNNKTR